MRLTDRLKRFFKDLRRRRVFRVAAAYLALAFVALQVSEIVFPALSMDRGLTIAVIVAIIGFPVTVVLVWIYDLTPYGVVRTPPMAEEESSEAGGTPPPMDAHAVAVLPFEQVGGEKDDEYFCEGIHDDILTSLSKVSDLRVVSRNSVVRYRGTSPDPLRVGQDLGVGSVLEGSVRRSANRVRISARLVETTTRRNVWAETYDRSLEDIFAIQQDVARHIVEALRAELSEAERARISTAPTTDFEAYDLYLRGRHLWNERTEKGLLGAIEPLRAAVDRDPGFALAHAGLADAFLTLALYGARKPGDVMPRASEAAERALVLEPELGEALAARGCVKALFEWDWSGAETDLQAASRLSPSYATAWQWLAIHVFAPRCRFGAAADALARARLLDPGSPAIAATEVFLLFLERRYAEAEDRCRTLVAESPSFALGQQFLGQVLHHRGNLEEAIDALERASELRGGTPEMRAAIAPVYAAAGREEEARAILDDLARARTEGYVSATRLARIEVALGDVEAALSHLELASTDRATDLIWAASDPEMDPLRAQPRFEQLLERMGLDDVVSPREQPAPS
jgi:TolB-like protein/Flp pilus assembly protein TadD